MPVESRDDLVKRLRDLAGETTLKCWEPRHGAWLSGLRDAATRIESDAKRIAELEAERDRIGRNRDMWKGQCERQAVALAEERERCATAAEDYPCPDNQTEDYSSGFIDACIFIATAIRSGKPDGKE